MAANSMVFPASYATTINLQISYLKPVTEGSFRAEGRCLKAGKKVLFCEASVFDEQHALVCTATSQFVAIPWKRRQTRLAPEQGSGVTPVPQHYFWWSEWLRRSGTVANRPLDERDKPGQIGLFLCQFSVAFTADWLYDKWFTRCLPQVSEQHRRPNFRVGTETKSSWRESKG